MKLRFATTGQQNGELKMNSGEQLTAERFRFQWLSYAQLRERFNIDKIIPGKESDKMEYENELCRNDEHVIAKIAF